MPQNRRILAAASLAFLLFAFFASTHAQQPAAVPIDNDDVGGTVTSTNGPEAGVWVIAETRDLGTRFIRSVVTDDRGRYVLPDLPKANYSIWVRGYGLVDSAKVTSAPGKQLNLTATIAPSEAAAAQYYPAIYWYSMLKIPAKDEFGKNPRIKAASQSAWLNQMKNNGCVGCHQLGQLSTRTIPAAFASVHPSSAAWVRRVSSGQSGGQMTNQLLGLGPLGAELLGDWTDRIAKGELPHAKPQRPQGVERNIVVTEYGIGDQQHYLHDVISTDKRNPTVNGYGQIYGSPEFSTDMLPILDPVKVTAKTFTAPVRDKDMPLSLGPGHAAALKIMAPSAYWGDQEIWDTRVNNHDSMLDKQGRVWLAAAIRAPQTPAYCRAGSDLPSAKLFPMDRNERQLAMWDPKTNKYVFVDTCFDSHHLQFGFDANDTVWPSGEESPVFGWVNTKKFLETGDIAHSMGWSAEILDTNGNGKRDAYVEPDQPVDPTKDKRISAGIYAVMPSPIDSSVWGSVRGNPGGVIRFVPGSNPPATALSEYYEAPPGHFGVRGGDIDSKGVVWVSMASGEIGAFDRKKCKGPLNGPKATGQQCPEGWSFYKYPGPGFDGIGDNSAESSYYSWVDQHDTLGLGNDVPVSTGNENGALLALKDGRFVVMAVPYPMGYYAKGMDGRIDDPNAGWKGRGMWSAAGDRTPWLKEGGKGNTPFAIHFQVRPDPLAH